MSAQAQPEHPERTGTRATMRADALASRQRLLAAAAALRGGRLVSMQEIAAAAGVGRSTLYRHFPTREALFEALEREQTDLQERSAPASHVATIAYKAPGQLGRERPIALEVTRILDEVPAHLVADQLVAEARRTGGVAVALYVVDIDGSHLLRLAGSEEFPERLEDPPAIGPEIVAEGLPAFCERLRSELPGSTVEPLWLRGRVTGLLLCIGQPLGSLADIARQGAAALELANDYSDFVESARRRKPTSAAAEIQQNLFPPRIARIAGAQLAGVLLPAYEVGGDWFDFVENRDGAWIAIADSAGKGPTAAGLGAAALGSLRAARRSGCDLVQAVDAMNDTVGKLGNPDFRVTAIIARWHAALKRLSWVNCGHPPAFRVDRENELRALEGPRHAPLGDPQSASYAVSEDELGAGERLILLTDGILRRRMEDGGEFGLEGLRGAIAQVEHPTAALTAIAVQRAVTDCWKEPLEDDGTVVVLASD